MPSPLPCMCLSCDSCAPSSSSILSYGTSRLLILIIGSIMWQGDDPEYSVTFSVSVHAAADKSLRIHEEDQVTGIAKQSLLCFDCSQDVFHSARFVVVMFVIVVDVMG